MHQTIVYKNQIPGVFGNEAFPLSGRKWNDTTQLHLGAEYRCSEKIAVRAGIQNDPVPFSTNQLTLTEINQYNFLYYSVGAGYTIGKVDLDVCYAYCPSDSPSIGDRNYKYNLDVFRFGLRYGF
jgi:long-subunit fatty acid transport protein